MPVSSSNSTLSSYGSVGGSSTFSEERAGLGINIRGSGHRSLTPDSIYSSSGSSVAGSEAPRSRLLGPRPMPASTSNSTMSHSKSRLGGPEDIEIMASCSGPPLPVSKKAHSGVNDQKRLAIPHITVQEPIPRLLELSPNPSIASDLLVPSYVSVAPRKTHSIRQQTRPAHVQSVRTPREPVSTTSHQLALLNKPLPALPDVRERKPVPPTHNPATIKKSPGSICPDTPSPSRKAVKVIEMSHKPSVLSRIRRQSVSQLATAAEKVADKLTPRKVTIVSRVRRASFTKPAKDKVPYGSYGAPLGSFTQM